MNKQYLTLKLDEWIEEQRLQEYASSTLTRYKANVLKFINWINNDEVITKDTTINYKMYLMNLNPRPKTSSINTWIKELNKYFKWLDAEELKLKTIKQQLKTSTEDVLSITDYQRLLRISKKLGMMKLYYIMKVLALTGCRIGELKVFTVENIQSNYLPVYNKGKERNLIVRQDLLRELKHYCKDNKIKSGIIFTNSKGDKIIPQKTIWVQMKKVAGIARVNKKKVHAHSFRHLFAQVFMDEYSGNITELADILGHNSLETTRTYTRTSDKQKKEKLEKLKFKNK